MMKILFVFGTRPEAIKMAPVIKECQRRSESFNVCVCVTAQHREMLDQVLNLFGITTDYDLDIMTQSQTLPDLTARVLLDVTRVIKKEDPNLVIVQGDTTTTYMAAVAAYYLRTPIAHIEAGLRTRNKYSPFPEEINRRLTSVLADLHFAPTQEAKDNLIREDVNGSSIYVTGNTVIDALMTVVRGQRSRVRQKELNEYFRQKWKLLLSNDTDTDVVDNLKLILVTGHRRESFGDGFRQICEALSILAKNRRRVQIVYPVHLNPNVQEPVYNILGGINNVHLIAPLDYESFVFLMNKCSLILTDSGGIQEEAPTLGKPILVMRDTSERHEGIEAGTAKLVGTDVESIVGMTKELLDNKDEYQRMSKASNPYGDGKASKRIVQTLADILDSKS